MKLTKKQIDEIRRHTPKELKGTQAHLHDILGHFTKAGANWSYLAGWTYEGALVVVVFGEVV